MLTAEPQWKEIIILRDEAGEDFVFYCGWGVTPPVAYVPAEADWARCVPPWLQGRREEAIAVLEATGHVLQIGEYRERWA